MNKNKILILLIISIVLITSCNTNIINKNISSSSDSEEINTTIITNEITAITDQNTFPDEESTDDSTKYNIGSATHEGDILEGTYIAFADGISIIKDTFSTRTETRSAINKYIDEFHTIYIDNETHAYKPDRPALLYYLIRKLELTREDIAEYAEADNSGVSETIIDALFSNDINEAMKILKSPYAFYINGNLYNIYDFYQLGTDKINELMVTSKDEIIDVMTNLNEYLKHGGYYSSDLKKYVEQFAIKVEPATGIIYDDSDNVIYQEMLKWYVNDEIVSLGFAEMYISASAKRTDPKYSQLRDPEIRLIHLIGENGAKEINAAIDKAVTEPYGEYISQIQSNNYTSDNLFVCQSHVTTYNHIALIEISFWTYSGTLVTGGRFGEPKIFYYNFAEDKVFSVSDVLNTVAINNKTFLEVFNNYAAIINSRVSNYTFENIQWLIPGETGITVCIFFNEYDEYPMEFTIPYNDLT